MSEQREVEGTVITNHQIPITSDEFKLLSRKDKKARLATVLERGLTADRLVVHGLPSDLYGEWVPNDPTEISRMEGMGFEMDTQYAVRRSLHGSGSGEARVGDVVFMITGRETHELINEIRAEKFQEVHGKPGQKAQREEREFQNALAIEAPGVKTINESENSAANFERLKEAITNKES